MNTTEKIWINGKLIPWKDCKIHILTHTLHYGLGIFEGIRLYKTENGPAIFRLKKHIDRLFDGLNNTQIKIPYTKKEIHEAIINTIIINKIEEGYIRPIVFYGYGKMGLTPEGADVDCCIAVWPWGKYLDKDVIKVKTSSFMRIHPKSTFSHSKICGHYVNSILASLEAKSENFDEALLMDYKGDIAEGSAENIFIIKNKVLITPTKECILPGITRDTVIIIANDLGYKIEEKNIKLEDALNADEAFLCGTAAEITAIGCINQTKINKSKAGPVTTEISKKYLEICHGKNKKYINWLTLV